MHSILRGNWIGISGWFFQQYNFLDASRQRNKKKLNSIFRIDAVNFRVWHSEHACCSSISNLFIFYWTWLWVKVQLNKYCLWMITLRSNVDIIWTKSNVLSQNSWIKLRSIKIGWQVLITSVRVSSIGDVKCLLFPIFFSFVSAMILWRSVILELMSVYVLLTILSISKISVQLRFLSIRSMK